jgi:hypothetical protein
VLIVAVEAECVSFKEYRDQEITEKFHRLKCLFCSLCELIYCKVGTYCTYRFSIFTSLI